MNLLCTYFNMDMFYFNKVQIHFQCNATLHFLCKLRNIEIWVLKYLFFCGNVKTFVINSRLFIIKM